MHFSLQLVLAAGLIAWIVRLGGPGLILLGIADNSVVPLTGSMDVLTIWLAASRPSLWPYYALMATAGAVLGGYITYSLAYEGGKEALERRWSHGRLQWLQRHFERWGFWAVAVPAVIPPPMPFVPFLMAAGAMQYPRKHFLGALTLGRGLRFSVVALLGSIYGDAIVAFFRQYYVPALLILGGLAVIGAIASLVEYLRFKKRKKTDEAGKVQAHIAA
jgi:membrane protein YqaA with SNARE-associated domain